MAVVWAQVAAGNAPICCSLNGQREFGAWLATVTFGSKLLKVDSGYANAPSKLCDATVRQRIEVCS